MMIFLGIAGLPPGFENKKGVYFKPILAWRKQM